MSHLMLTFFILLSSFFLLCRSLRTLIQRYLPSMMSPMSKFVFFIVDIFCRINRIVLLHLNFHRLFTLVSSFYDAKKKQEQEANEILFLRKFILINDSFWYARSRIKFHVQTAKLYRFQFSWECWMQRNKVDGKRGGRKSLSVINNKRMRLRAESIEKLCKKKMFLFLSNGRGGIVVNT